MFSVTGLNGELFRGNLETLLSTHRVDQARHLRGLEEEGEDAEAPPLPAVVPRDADRYHAAAAAYARVVHPAPDRGPIYHAYQVMHRDVLTVAADARVDAAWQALVTRGVGQAPVVTREGRLVGLVARAHLLHVLNEEGGRLRDVLARRVADVMATPVVAADPVSDVRRIARVLLEYGLPAVPVLDDAGLLVGIVSRGDILRVVVTDPPLTLWA
ncbi:MAG: CBS domain-containing protein [Acidobacteria bacterium]|nr:CBS domain-containing protein [Acidobacteriota bacterium]